MATTENKRRAKEGRRLVAEYASKGGNDNGDDIDNAIDAIADILHAVAADYDEERMTKVAEMALGHVQEELFEEEEE